MRYLLATCPATDPPAVMLISESETLPGGGLRRSIEIGCWAGCGRDVTHPLAELDPAGAVAALRTETDRAETALAAVIRAEEARLSESASRGADGDLRPSESASLPGSSPPHDGPSDGPRISNNRRITNRPAGREVTR